MKASTNQRLTLLVVIGIFLVGTAAVFLGLKLLDRGTKPPILSTNTPIPVMNKVAVTPIVSTVTHDITSMAETKTVLPVPLIATIPVADLPANHPPFDFEGQTCESCHTLH